MQPIDSHTRLVLLLGYPLGHSLSPLIHNTAFELLDLNLRYICAPVKPELLPAAIEGLRALNILGCNVTIPHKTGVFKGVDTCSQDARFIGAVNTVVCQQKEEKVSLFGDNTDIEGFLFPLRPYSDQLSGRKKMVILGNGGAARAVAYALLKTFSPSRLTVVGRNVEKVNALIHSIEALDPGEVLEASPFEKAYDPMKEATLVVNATPVGMNPNQEETPWPQSDTFSKGQIVYDLIYNPLETRLLKEAKNRGATIIGGLEMLIQQAAASFQLWTGLNMPVNQVKDKLLEEFEF